MPGPNKAAQIFTIVGVTGDVRHVRLDAPPRSEVFLNAMQAPLPWPWATIVARTDGDPAPFADTVKAEIHEANPTVAVQRVNTLEQVVALSIVGPRIYTFLLGTFAALALLLAAIGLYGLIAYSVSQRTREIGVRVALGATRRSIVRLVIRQGLWLVATGSLLGLAGAIAATRLLVGLMKGVQPKDPLTFGLVTLVLLLAASVASYLPARRAARVDPMIALRAE